MKFDKKNYEKTLCRWDTVQNTCIDVKSFMKMGKYI